MTTTEHAEHRVDQDTDHVDGEVAEAAVGSPDYRAAQIEWTDYAAAGFRAISADNPFAITSDVLVAAQLATSYGIANLAQVITQLDTLLRDHNATMTAFLADREQAGRHTPDHAAVAQFPIEKADAAEQASEVAG
jgi:hypothetical protein